MKKFFYLAMALSLVACQAEKVDVGGGTEGTEANYLYVNLVNNARGTRADKPAADDFEDGYTETVKESTVSSVRLYFFDAEEKAFDLGEGKSYMAMTSTDAGDEMPNVEHILAATVVIKVKSGASIPASVVAVLNPNADVEEKNYTLAKLEEIVSAVPVTGNFVMSNSVYSDEATTQANKIVATTIKPENLCPTEAAAKNKPVTIHVERTVAKVRLSSDVADNKKKQLGDITLYDTGETYSYEVEGEDDGEPTKKEGQIYAKFEGWNVTGTANKTYLLKNINPSWGSGLFGSTEMWNYVPYYRSFWALNPDGDDKPSFEYGDFTKAKAVTTPFPSITYVRENAAVTQATGAESTAEYEHTKVIIGAQLVDENGEALEVAEYAGIQYYGKAGSGTTIGGAEAALKKVYANYEGIYKVTKTGSETKIDKIEAGDIKFITAKEAGEAKIEGATNEELEKQDRYYVFATLEEATNGYTWTSNPDAATYNPTTDNLSREQVIAKLKALGHAKIWKSGLTYYYFDIEHLGEEIGKLGVVRNHVYDAKIKTLVGLGTPVYDPNETIYPEKTDKDDVVIAAQINILSWRIVNQNVNLEW